MDGSFTTGEQFSSKISNRYITLPVLIRKYITPKKHLFIEAGVYSGYLISSSANQTIQKELVFNKSELISSYYSEIELDDEDKAFTNNIDYGISIGTGFAKKVFERIILKVELRTNVGLKKLDARYNNEFESIPAAGGATFTSTLVRATNYHGFNSNSKNLNSTLTIGFGYNIN